MFDILFIFDDKQLSLFTVQMKSEINNILIHKNSKEKLNSDPTHKSK